MRRIRAILLALSLIGGAVAVSASPAHAATSATCGSNYYGGVAEWPRVTKGTWAAIHTGPYSNCYVPYWVGTGSYVPAICYVVNNYNNQWTYVNYGNGVRGWIWNAYLTGLSRTPRC